MTISPPDSSNMVKKSTLPALMFGALGVVFGDIGTSPLYALKEAFGGPHAVGADPSTVMGILSMMFWLLMIIVSVKYVILVLWADNKGEGGDFALLALNLKLTAQRPWLHYGIGLLGILGGCLFYADAVITPAISVLSAVEGVQVVSHQFDDYVLPVTLLILLCLFALQRSGTARVGFLFGPITFAWFISIAIIGMVSIVETPAILGALSPHYAAIFIWNNPLTAFIACGAIVLVITGAEALYADMGHFGRTPIRLTWIFVAACLILNYFGQGALLVRNPGLATGPDFNPFYQLVPSGFIMPVLVLATLATAVASQATISGAFSITRQAMQLGYLPRMKMVHTSSSEMGQIYIPFINWAMLVAVIIMVVSFQTSSGLASAYGIAVTGAMMVTTCAISIVMIRKWQWPVPVVILVLGFFLMIEGMLLAANVTKIMSGGWVPLMVALFLFTLLTTWFRGQKILSQVLSHARVSVRDFAEDFVKQNYRRVPGVGVYMTPRKHVLPEPMVLNLKYNKVLHERVILLTVQTTNEPFAERDERYDIQELADNFYRVIIRYGFLDEPNLDRDMRACIHHDELLFGDDVAFFLGHESVIPTRGTGMAIWREHIYAWMKRNAGSAVDFYRVPPRKVMEIGGQYEI